MVNYSLSFLFDMRFWKLTLQENGKGESASDNPEAEEIGPQRPRSNSGRELTDEVGIWRNSLGVSAAWPAAALQHFDFLCKPATAVPPCLELKEVLFKWKMFLINCTVLQCGLKGLSLCSSVFHVLVWCQLKQPPKSVLVALRAPCHGVGVSYCGWDWTSVFVSLPDGVNKMMKHNHLCLQVGNVFQICVEHCFPCIGVCHRALRVCAHLILTC